MSARDVIVAVVVALVTGVAVTNTASADTSGKWVCYHDLHNGDPASSRDNKTAIKMTSRMNEIAPHSPAGMIEYTYEGRVICVKH